MSLDCGGEKMKTNKFSKLNMKTVAQELNIKRPSAVHLYPALWSQLEKPLNKFKLEHCMVKFYSQVNYHHYEPKKKTTLKKMMLFFF